jgi:hypothetical protein
MTAMRSESEGCSPGRSSRFSRLKLAMRREGTLTPGVGWRWMLALEWLL